MSLRVVIAISVAIVLVGLFFVISKVGDLYFLNDDNLYIPLSKNWNFLYGTSFRPISDISLFIDYSIWGTNPLGYHLTNLVLHLATTAMLFVFSRPFFKRYSEQHYGAKAVTVTVLFFFYPFHSEPLYWIIGRGGLFATLFGVCSLYFFLLRTESRWALPLSIVFFLIGAFAYETIWIVPLIIIAISWIDYKQYHYPKRSAWKDVGIFWLFFVAYLAVRTAIIGEIGGTPYGNTRSINFDLLLWVKNYSLAFARSFIPPMKSTTAFVLAFSLFLLILAGVLTKMYRAGSLTNVTKLVGAFLLVSFVPIINFGVDSHDSESERFLYFPSVFVLLLITEWLYELIKSKRIVNALVMLLVILEISLLAIAASSYQKGSIIAKATIDAVAQTRSNQTMYFIDLPTQYKGALIFRVGVREAINWLTPDSASRRIVVISDREIEEPVTPYRVSTFSTDESGIKGESLRRLQSLMDTARLQGYAKEKDVIFFWTDSALFTIEDR